MLYEKKKVKSKKYITMVCVEILLLCMLIMQLFYFYVDFPKDFWSMKAVDIANVIAQIATASAFYLGFHQYHRNKRVERQAVLVAECKALIVQMIVVIKELKGGLETDFENIKHCSIKLGNLGSDFQEFFVELDENVNKGVVRMHWQNMFFNELLKAMEQLDLSAATDKTNIRPESYLFALATAKVKIKHGPVCESLERYFIHLYVLQSDLMKTVRDGFEFSDLYLFILYFFEGEYSEDYMYGALSKLDVRTRAPLIAAINDVCQFKRLVKV